MSDLSRSAKVNLDYKTFHETGRKEIKPSQNTDLNQTNSQPGDKVSAYLGKMAWAEKSVLELQIDEDISESLLIFAAARVVLARRSTGHCPVRLFKNKTFAPLDICICAFPVRPFSISYIIFYSFLT